MNYNYLSIDVGGTQVKWGLIDKTGNLIERDSEDTILTNKMASIDQFQKIIDRYKGQIRGIGFSVPGKVDHNEEKIFGGGSLNFLDKVILSDELTASVPIAVENDGKAAALADLWLGNLKDIHSGISLVFGTGVAGGIVIGNELWTGKHFQAGELSFGTNTAVNIFDRNVSSTIMYRASAVRMIQRIAYHLKLKDQNDGLSVFELINSGNKIALDIFDNWVDEVALLIYNIQTVMDFQRVVIGGGISAQPIVLKSIREKYFGIFSENEMVNDLLTPVEIMSSKFSNNANLYGAVYHLLDKIDNNVI